MSPARTFDQIEKEEIVDLLNRCWMTHDGMWFFQTFREMGLETTNRLNKAAIRSLAPLEVQRIRRILGLEKEDPENFEEFREFLTGAARLVIPDFIGGDFSFLADNVLRWEFPGGQCFAYKGIKRIGALEGYECGVIFRLQCWFEALGLSYTLEPTIGKCRMISGAACIGEFKFLFGKNSDLEK